MSEALVHYWPQIVALVVIVMMFADIRSQSKRTAKDVEQSRDDLKEHRRESAESNKAMSEKVDGVVSDLSDVKADVAGIKARVEVTERLRAVK